MLRKPVPSGVFVSFSHVKVMLIIFLNQTMFSKIKLKDEVIE